ncbi:uncharacterized protein LOC129584532 [Paramacrobiotus metropolitanus]|uniref:uncharacterized protein LOC129584532 n=1 Tax=Paramacrobiotus metropolitanus TaxID=2943436 RepID=UPI002445E3CA|nr:uncharacterized protein LOC129584532 [Paramacrobiotus metropolitanus]
MEASTSTNNPNVDVAQVNVLEVITSGEEWLSSIMKGISEIFGTGRITAFPVDKAQLATLTARMNPVPEWLKGISESFRRLRILEEVLNTLIPENVPIEELVCIRGNEEEDTPQNIEDMFKSKVDSDLWKEYEELRDELLKQDAYIKRIIDAERMFLQEVNCILYP